MSIGAEFGQYFCASAHSTKFSKCKLQKPLWIRLFLQQAPLDSEQNGIEVSLLWVS